MRSLRLTLVPGSLIVLAALLVGCSPSGATHSVLDRAAEPADEPPSVVAESSEDIAADSARFVGEHNGAGLWLARSTTENGICLIVHSNARGWVTGCTDGGGQLGVSGPAGAFVVLPDGSPTPDGTSQLTENVFVATR
jgi:hypothetical protein